MNASVDSDTEAAAVLHAAGRSTGVELRLVGRYAGTNGALQALDGEGRPYVVKAYHPDEAVRDWRRMTAITALLRARGVPLPRYEVSHDPATGLDVLVYPELPGSPVREVTPRFAERFVAVNRLQAEPVAGSPPTDWPAFILRTVREGGPGYCLRSTLEGHDPRTRELLARIDGSIASVATLAGSCPTTDAVHMDLNAENVLVDAEGVLQGMIDWEGVRLGDRAFDLVTFAFSLTGHPESSPGEQALWREAGAISADDAILVYVCHLAIRYVDWAVRYATDSDVGAWCERSHDVLGRMTSSAA